MRVIPPIRGLAISCVGVLIIIKTTPPYTTVCESHGAHSVLHSFIFLVDACFQRRILATLLDWTAPNLEPKDRGRRTPYFGVLFGDRLMAGPRLLVSLI